jgi:hypothetical protein
MTIFSSVLQLFESSAGITNAMGLSIDIDSKYLTLHLSRLVKKLGEISQILTFLHNFFSDSFGHLISLCF